MEVKYNKIIIDGVDFNTTKDGSFESYITFDRSYDKRELKMLLFTDYSKGYLDIRKKISIEVDDIKKYKDLKKIIIKTGKYTPIGCGEVLDIKNNIITLDKLLLYDKKKEEYVENVDVLFDKKASGEYKNGLFKIYYKMLENEFKYYNEIEFDKKKNIKSHTKFTAMCTYLAAKEVLKDYGCYLSESNVFIQNKRVEYDALLLKKELENKGIYQRDEVLATIELKTSGIQKRDIPYEKLKDNFNDYINEEKCEKIPHIYLSAHENEKKSKELKSNNAIVIFCALKKSGEYFTIPDNYDLDILLKPIKR